MKKIALSGKKGLGKFVLISDKDYQKVKNIKWWFNGYYARNTNIGFLHKFILNYPKGLEADHINGNKLDNRRSNLRICTHSENGKNMKKWEPISSSIYKGVSWFKRDKCWRARIRLNYKQLHIGYFDKERWAAMAYDIAAKDLFGDFAKLNFINIYGK